MKRTISMHGLRASMGLCATLGLAVAVLPSTALATDAVEGEDGEHAGHRVLIERSDVRVENPDGTRTRTRTRTTRNPETGEIRERTREIVELADGTKVEVRTETRTAADGTILRHRTREKTHGGGSDRADRADRPEREDRAERPPSLPLGSACTRSRPRCSTQDPGEVVSAPPAL